MIKIFFQADIEKVSEEKNLLTKIVKNTQGIFYLEYSRYLPGRVNISTWNIRVSTCNTRDIFLE
jgi:hypothetical protein